MLVSLTVGKVDAGVAVLLTEDKRLIEFPSILLPPDIASGSIVDINVSRNFDSEQRSAAHFSSLQDEIFNTFGLNSPSPPVLRCRNATQTSVVLEWDPMSLATAELRSLSLYRNGSKAGNIPKDKLSTKISGLAVDTEYTFHLILRTSAGTYTSERLTVRTQKMTDLTGITITPGVMPAQLRDDLAATVERIGAKLIDTVRIDTTHFVCTEGRGQAWEKAVEMNVPVVVPDWVKGCEREGRIVGVRGYYLNADPKLRQVGPGVANQSQTSLGQQQQQQSGPESRRPSQLNQNQNQNQPSQLRVQPPMSSPRIEHTPPTPDQAHPEGDEVPPTPPPKLTSHSPSPLPNVPETVPEAEPESQPTTQPEAQPEPEPQSYQAVKEAAPEVPEPVHDEATPAVNGTAEEEAPSDSSEEPIASEPTSHQDEAEPETEAPVNNLKAIGIPHDEPEVKTPKSEDGGGFDEVAL